MKITVRITNRVKIQATAVQRAPLIVVKVMLVAGGNVAPGPVNDGAWAKLISGATSDTIAPAPATEPKILKILLFIYVFLLQRPFDACANYIIKMS